MTKTNPLNIFAVALLLTGCASTYDLSQGGTGALGGGYLEEEIIDGVYRLEVRLNISLFSTQAYANEEWHRRARKLCREQGYREVHANERSQFENQMTVPVPVGGAMIFVSGSSANYGKRGYIACSDVKLDDDEIMDEVWSAFDSRQ